MFIWFCTLEFCTKNISSLTIDPSHKSHSAPVLCSTMYHFVTEMCTHVHISVTKWCIVGYGNGVLWDLCKRSIIDVCIQQRGTLPGSHCQSYYPGPVFCLLLGVSSDCLANHRTGYFSNLACDWLSIVWAYCEQETENGPWYPVLCAQVSATQLKVDEIYECPILKGVVETLLHDRVCFKNAYELLNLRALKISTLYKNYIFQCMGQIFCVEFQRVPLKFHT